MRSTSSAILGAVIAVVAFVSCGDDDSAPTSSPEPAESSPESDNPDSGSDSVPTSPAQGSEDPADTTSLPPDPNATYPPMDIADLAVLLDPILAEHEVHITRGGLVDRSDGYEFSETGDHLALYVEPDNDDNYGTDDYLEGIVEITAITAEWTFSNYSGVRSYDICQEPHTADSDSDTPPPVTQVELTRDLYESASWDDMTLTELLELTNDDPENWVLVQLWIQETPEYQEAWSEAGIGL